MEIDQADSVEHYPRIGGEYQAVVPELMRIDDYIRFSHEPGVHEPLDCGYRHEVELNFNEDRQFRCLHVGAKIADTEREGQRFIRIQDVVDDARILNESISLPKKVADLDGNLCSACSLRANEWTDLESKSFLLGLYTFGKDFYLVKKFVETRNMSDLLDYYYAKFKRSPEYIRWSQSRKMKGKQSIHRDKIYKDWRLHVLLSRMTSHVSSELKKLLTEVTKKFKKSKLSLTNYVFTLKDLVCVSLLIEAVAIGKEGDLTRETTKKAALSTLCNEKEPSTKKSTPRFMIDLNQPYLSPEIGQSSTTLGCKTKETATKVVLSTLYNDKEPSTGKSKPWSITDLNPYLSPESGTDESVMYNVHTSYNSSSSLTEIRSHYDLINSSSHATGKAQPVTEGRRQSSRKRELTMKALEAIALDLCGPRKRRKATNSSASVSDNVHPANHCSSHLMETHDHLELNHINDVTGKEKPAVTCLRRSSRLATNNKSIGSF